MGDASLFWVRRPARYATDHNGSDKARLAQGYAAFTTGCLEGAAIRSECLADDLFGVMKIIEVIAGAERIGLNVQRSGTGKAAGRRSVRRNQQRDF